MPYIRVNCPKGALTLEQKPSLRRESSTLSFVRRSIPLPTSEQQRRGSFSTNSGSIIAFLGAFPSRSAQRSW